ncbi:hypothetical protein V8G54_021081 [Vigna mungo]|uniref:SWIM-type domain-containing protein n=1 Tax=Vigna mungo TaxID=3915 RepID=A0AAQ3NEX8_VIGMU
MVCSVVIERDVEDLTEAVIKGLPLERKKLRLEEGMSKVTARRTKFWKKEFVGSGDERRFEEKAFAVDVVFECVEATRWWNSFSKILVIHVEVLFLRSQKVEGDVFFGLFYVVAFPHGTCLIVPFVVFHHGGKFLNDGSFGYRGGETSNLMIDIDRWSYFEMLAILKEMGYINVKELWYSLGGRVLEDKIELITDDKGAMHVVNIALLNGKAHVFVVHKVCDPVYLLQLEYNVGQGGEDDNVGEGEGQAIEGGDDVEHVHVEEDVQAAEGGDDVEHVHVEEDVQAAEGGDDVEHVHVEEDVQAAEGGDDVEHVHVEEDVQAAEGGDDVEHVHVEEDVQAAVVHDEVGGVEEVVHDEGGGAEEDVHDDVGGGEQNVQEEVEVSSWIGSDEEGSDDLVDVDVHAAEQQEDVQDLEGSLFFEMGTGSGSTSKVHKQARGLSDTEWESDSCGSIYASDDSDEETPRNDTFGIFSEPVNMKEYKWELGTYFPDKIDFTDAVRTYGIHNGRKLKIFKNDKRRICVKCCGSQGKCPWYAYCAYRSTQSTWQLRKIIDRHTCTREFNIGLVTSKWLSGKLEKSMKVNPEINLKNLHSKFCQKWNIGVSRSTTTKAKAMATANIEGCFKQQYQRLYDYAHEILRSNPGSTVQVKVDRVGDDVIFNRIYVCLKACQDSFVSCRPIIHLDGCFLKGKYGGELLTAVARDANDQMCPLAYAVVEVENKDTWTWFLELLIDDVGGGAYSSRCTFVSDQQKGLKLALQQLLPGVDQRFCVRHIYANFRKKYPGINLRQLLWKAATATNPQAWESIMRQMKDVNEEAFKHLFTIPPRSRFSARPACDTIVNNICEGFNSVILEAREKPIITMLEDIRSYLMKRWASNREKITKFDGPICPKIKKRLQKELEKTQYWIPNWSGLQVFEIRHASNLGEKVVVDVQKRECSCRKWTVSGIPCCHALTAMRFLNITPEDYLPIWFRTSTYEETYIPIIFPLNGPELWERTQFPDILPPPNRVLPGRPRKKRRLESGEQKRDDTQLGQAGIPKRCSCCRQVGHRRPNCPQATQQQHPTPTTDPTQPSEQQDPTQASQAVEQPTQESHITDDHTTTTL